MAWLKMPTRGSGFSVNADRPGSNPGIHVPVSSPMPRFLESRSETMHGFWAFRVIFQRKEIMPKGRLWFIATPEITILGRGPFFPLKVPDPQIPRFFWRTQR